MWPLVCLVLLSPVSAADLILHNAKILTVDARFNISQAVAISGSRIEAVGSNEDILKLRTANTKVIDAQGKTILPGLTDSHVHALGAGLSEQRLKLPKLDSFAAIQSYLRDRSRETPKGQWIIVPRTFPTRLKEMAMPTREVLDVATDHPVGFDASYVWVFNSFALRQSGITRDTAPPSGGEIGKDDKGEPNGILRNANKLIKGLPRNTETFAYTKEEKLQSLLAMLKRYQEAGLTSIGDRAVTEEDIELYQRLARQGKLPVRAVLTWRLDASPDTDKVVARLKNAPKLDADPAWLKFGAFKVTLDGGMTIGTAFQRYPYGEFGRQLYGQANPDARGQLFIPPAKLYDIMSVARDLGWPLTAHSQGGGAIDALLDCFERLDKQKPIAPTRSHLMHASFQSKEAIDRLAKLHLPADVQMAWLYLDGPALSRVFPNNGMRYFIPLKSYRERGVILAAGSDHMVGHNKNSATNPYNPFLGMWTAITRQMTDGKVLHPEERISREEALRMYTSWAAWLQHAEQDRGSIEKGKLADLTMIDRDYLRVPAAEVREIQPLLVIVDGKVVLQR